MAKSTPRKKSQARAANAPPAALLVRLRRDAQALVSRSTTQVLKDVRAVRVGAERAVRDLERKVVKQLHAATEGQVRALERRLAALERRVDELGRTAGAA
jgi:uncharacterized protein YceH (UPF0502 family)